MHEPSLLFECRCVPTRVLNMGFLHVQNKPTEWNYHLAQMNEKKHTKLERPWKTDHQKILQGEGSYHGAVADDDQSDMLKTHFYKAAVKITIQHHWRKAG